MRIQVPNNWQPRHYQRKAWSYLENGGKHAELIWHRRSGKDDLALNWGAVAAFERPANYWHMLPEYGQARKAIWQAVNPRTGKRRIDEAFPKELRSNTREQEMQIMFKNGSTWQLVGADSFNSLVGSTPAGVVFSEWALTNPAARAYLRPILAENNGWQVYITTPRGRNHAMRTYNAAKASSASFAQLLTVDDTGVISPERLEEERKAYISEYGADEGMGLFEQEYYCSWAAAILGAYYAKEMRQAENEGRIRVLPFDPESPVFTAWDLGYRDDTAIWFYQVVRGEIRVMDYYAVSGASIEEIAVVVIDKGYRYTKHYLPHDARAKTLASGGKSIVEQLAAHLGGMAKLAIVPDIGIQDGIQAVRMILPYCYFDPSCDEGLEALRQYQREYDEDKKTFRQNPRHDWCSHPADAFRMLAVAYRQENKDQAPPKGKTLQTITLDEMWEFETTHKQERI